MEEQRLTLAMTGFLLSESQRMSDINNPWNHAVDRYVAQLCRFNSGRSTCTPRYSAPLSYFISTTNREIHGSAQQSPISSVKQPGVSSLELFRIITKRIPSSDDLRPPLGTASTRLDWPNFTASSTLECQASESVFSVVSQETMICFQWSGLVRGLGMERRYQAELISGQRPGGARVLGKCTDLMSRWRGWCCLTNPIQSTRLFSTERTASNDLLTTLTASCLNTWICNCYSITTSVFPLTFVELTIRQAFCILDQFI